MLKVYSQDVDLLKSQLDATRRDLLCAERGQFSALERLTLIESENVVMRTQLEQSINRLHVCYILVLITIFLNRQKLIQVI